MSLDGYLSGAQSVTTTISSGTNTVLRAAADLGLGTVGGKFTSWGEKLQPASFRGVPFCVIEGESRFGRKNVVHEYPYRDQPWIEDLGKSARAFSVTGFLVGDDVIAQRDKMIAAAESSTDMSTLVHPTYGQLKVNLVGPLSVQEVWDRGRMFEIRFSFIESGERLYPTGDSSTKDAVKAKGAATNDASSASLLSKIGAAIKQGASVVLQAAGTAAIWARKIQNLSNDATNLKNLVSTLSGQLGRFGSGNNLSGYSLSGAFSAAPTTTPATLQSLIAQGSAARSAVSEAATGLATSAASLSGDPSTVTGFAASAQALVGTLLAASSADPAGAVRVISQLASFSPAATAVSSSSPIGVAMATVQKASNDMFRRAAVVAMALASADYQPSSSDDAARVRGIVCSALDAEITIAGDQGEDAVFNALRDLRAAVVLDLTARGAGLPNITTIATPSPIPSLVLAQQIYRDPSRADELVMQANCPHPAFMPVSFKALSQ